MAIKKGASSAPGRSYYPVKLGFRSTYNLLLAGGSVINFLEIAGSDRAKWLSRSLTMRSSRWIGLVTPLACARVAPSPPTAQR